MNPASPPSFLSFRVKVLGLQGLLGQGNQPVLVAFGVADVDPHVSRINLSGFQPDPFAKTQAYEVDGEEKNSITQLLRSAD